MVLKREPDFPDRIPDAPSDYAGDHPRSGGRGGAEPNFSLGKSIMFKGATVLALPGIPNLYDAAGTKAQITLIKQAIKENQASNKGVIPVAVAKPIPPPPVTPPPVSQSDIQGAKLNKPTTTTEKPMADLGIFDTILDTAKTAVDIYGKYQTAKVTPQYVDYKTASVGAPQMQQTFGVPFVDVIPEQDDSTKGMVWNPRANCGQGKWVKIRRRRRRRLASVSDIKDLAALQSVLGKGKAFETWIATHN